MSNEGDSRVGAGRPTAFLSYSRVDQAKAHALAEVLEASGIEVWWDTLIEGGAAFSKSIAAALEKSNAVIVLWSPASVGSDWVLDEATRGRDLRKLVPLLLDVAEPPLGFLQYHAIDISSWDGSSADATTAKIVQAVAALAGQEPPVPRRATPRASGTNRARRKLLVGGIAAAVAAAAGGGIAWRRGVFAGKSTATGNSVAVLPFENLSGDPQQVYFSDGLSEEVRATLARDARLRVMAQASTSQFRGQEADAVSIAARLGVAFLLDGSVRRSGDTLRIAADLIDGATGFSRWAQSFDRSNADVFAVQEEIAGAVAAALAAQVGAAPGPGPVAIGGTRNPAAFDAFLRGRALYDLSADEESERAALAQFELAIATDPGYAAAHAARARALTTLANQYGAVEQHAAMHDQAIAAARRAIELAPELGEAHSTLGFILFQGRLDARAAREPFERSATLGAGESTVMARFAQYCARMGRDPEAVSAMQRALALDPLNPLIHRAVGSIEYAARRYEASIPALRRALDMNPRMSRAHASLGDALLNLGRIGEARAEYLLEPSADFRLAGLAIAEQRAGDPAKARSTLDEMVATQGDRVLYQQAQVLAQFGEIEAALSRLEQARGLGDAGLIYARNDPFLDPLRGDPRMQRLLADIGFEPPAQ